MAAAATMATCCNSAPPVERPKSPPTASVTVGSSGLLDLTTYSANATIYDLALNTAPVSSADVQTGAGTLDHRRRRDCDRQFLRRDRC